MIFHNTSSIIISGLALALLVSGFGRMVFVHFTPATLPSAEKIESRAPDPFSFVDLTARAAFVFDVNNKMPLYARNENAQLPLASLSKIMTALIAVTEYGEDSPVVITKDAVLQEGDQGFIVGERWRLKDLVDATLLASSNDGARALASVFGETSAAVPVSKTAAFVRQMNRKAQAIGMHQTFFINDSGLDVNTAISGAYGSARDMAILLQYVLLNYPDLMKATSHPLLTARSLDGTEHNFKNTNDFVKTLLGLVVSKTGFTDLAGGNIAVTFDAGPARPIIAVVLGSTEEDRFTDIEQLISAALRFIAL